MEEIIKFIESILYWWVGLTLAVVVVILLIVSICLGVSKHKKTKLNKAYKLDISSLQARYTATLKDKDELTKANTELENKIKELTEDIKLLNDDYAKLEESVDSTVETLNGTKLTLEDARKEVALYNEKLNKSVEIITAVKKENEELKEKLLTANKTNEALLSTISLKKTTGTSSVTSKKKPSAVTGKYAGLGRKELFKKAHEVGLGNFAQWSNAKLAKEIEKKETK